jgi:hypothetical protein
MPENMAATDNLQSATDNLADQTRKLDIAAFYTSGDIDKARQMLAGSYKDLYAIKGKFSSSSVYGLFLIFFNHVNMTFNNRIYGIVSNSYVIDDVKTNQNWRSFEKQIEQLLKQGEHDDVLASQIRDELLRGLDFKFANEIKKVMQAGDEIALNHQFQKLAQDRFGFQQMKVSIDFDSTTSLDVELNSISSKKIDANELKRAEEETPEEKPKSQLDDALQGKEVKLILEGNVILSPIKGKDIGEVVVGDRVRIRLNDDNPKSVSLAKAFNAYDGEKIAPITGRVVSIRHQSTGGFKIFAIVAKGIYIRIDEEEESIKVAMDPAVAAQAAASATTPANEGSQFSMPLVILLVIVFSALVGVLLVFIL